MPNIPLSEGVCPWRGFLRGGLAPMAGPSPKAGAGRMRRPVTMQD
ncbi:hypothetical protein [Azospirillum doebereinerae]